MKSIQGIRWRRYGFPLLSLALLLLGADRTQAQPTEDCREVIPVEITHVFEPRDIVISKGDCVWFTNIHSIEHSAVGLEREFNTGVLLVGGDSLIPFKEAAEIPYWCGLHPPMVGSITVK